MSIYDDKTFTNGTIQQKAEFKVGVSIMTFTYYLVLTYEPKYNSFTWTLDYSRSSDFGKLTVYAYYIHNTYVHIYLYVLLIPIVTRSVLFGIYHNTIIPCILTCTYLLYFVILYMLYK